MAKMNMQLEKDANEVKYISILRKNTNKSINELKTLLNNNEYVLSYNILDIDELLEMKKIISSLLNAGAKVHIYEDNREVNMEFLDNLIESYMDTLKYQEEVDEQINGD
ncbi:hypothetical protein [Guptibacillus sedimenti]|uniref:hypothetical protein n=1 Tax=Guptibacillus sedimenti TaxID=3025680 RepID=UPI00235FD5E9|nr:hypothetical protein [Pseudalkalibacillus sedimenti]